MTEKKEQLLLEVEGTATWRTQMFEQYSDPQNQDAATSLLELYDYLKDLDDNHPIFSWYWDWVNNESEIEKLNNEIRSYGYQNISESPEEFVDRLMDQTIKDVESDDDDDYGYDDYDDYGYDDGYKEDYYEEDNSNEEEENYYYDEDDE